MTAGAARWLSRRPPEFTLQDAAELTGLLATLSRSGLPPGRIWRVLALEHAAFSDPARTVAGMVSVGGGVAAGLARAARETAGEGTRALTWLMVTARVADRTGAPIATVYDGLVDGIEAELAQAGETAVALAGPRMTARVLGFLPVAGFGLGLLMGVNTVGILIGTPAGRLCLLAGALVWLAGHRWIRRLLASAHAAS